MDQSNAPTPTVPPKSNNLKINLDMRVIIVLLLLVIAGMLAAWKPWHSAPNNARTISVTGDATISAAPDEFVFNPQYDFNNTDKTAALAELTKQSTAIVSELKKLGVQDNKIKTNADSYNNYYFYDESTRQSNYSLQISVTTSDKTLTQKVQDYLVTTTPTGAVSPQANFSEAKRKQLESTAREQATKDARKKAEQSAQNIGFKIGSVKSVTDGSGFKGPMPYETGMLSGGVGVSTKESLPVQSGQNDITYNVQVEYYLK